MEKCPICADWCGPKSKEISRKKASKTAHELAEKEADIGIAVLEWEEVYALYFQKIYRHEYKRNLELEQEIELEESVKRNQHNPAVCDYHQENILWMRDGTHKKTMKRLRRNYAQSKWPKALKSY